MLDFYERRRLKAVLFHPVVRVVLVGIFILIAYSAYVRFEIASEMSERRTAVESNAAELREQKARLEKEVEYLSTDRGIEAEMRRQFDIALPGEEVVVIIDDQATSEESVDEQVLDETPWYQFWR